MSRGARTLREARSGGYGVWVRTFFGICERGVAVAILCQPRGRAGGATGKVGHRRVPSALLNRMCELPLANSRRKHPLAMCACIDHHWVFTVHSGRLGSVTGYMDQWIFD